jgi:Glycosyl hydrolases family 38 N-terminal domain/Glycosyl hydrolases family 38 C-terminal domain
MTIAPAPTPTPAPTPAPALVPITPAPDLVPTAAPTAVLTPVPEAGPAPALLPPPNAINLDAATQALIAKAKRTVFLIPFSHWDTDWHGAFPDYSRRAANNIIAAIQIAKRQPRFRYTLEQVLFVKQFWETYPEHRADLTALIRSGQFTFAAPNVAQPDTSLVAPMVQLQNFRLGQDWIATTFGVQAPTAWEADSFGHSAAEPIWLNQLGLHYVFMGRGRGLAEQRRRPGLFPHAFYWASPADPTQRVLAVYLFYSDAWGPVYQLKNLDEQVAALRTIVDREFGLTSSRYLFLPFGGDFSSPLPTTPDMVGRWNATDPTTALVMADPQTAFQYLATQPLPQFTTDLNPIWQGFYGSRPAGKIADKESEYYLTAADKFGLLTDAPRSSAWYTATINAHHDTMAGTAYDRIWETSAGPRFAQTVAAAAGDLSRTLAQIASGVAAPVLVFNPTSWLRSGVVEIQGDLPAISSLPQPVQQISPDHVAFWADSVPPVGYMAPASASAGAIPHPASIARSGQQVVLSNGLVSVTLDSDHGGAFSSMRTSGGPELLAGYGDDVVSIDDAGDVYGAFFGAERARSSQAPAQITVLAEGPLLARAQAVFVLGGQPLTRTITLRADSPLIDVALDISALPETTAIVQTPTTRASDMRTDDLGFAAFTHPIDNRPIISGTITYRREVFYPITAWGDVSADGAGLTLISHGLQGLGGTSTLNLMLLREVSDGGRPTSEGVTERGYRTLRYAYLPHTGAAREAQPWLATYEFNQPLIPAWRSGDQIAVQLPFLPGPPALVPVDRAARTLPAQLSLIAAESGIVADLYRRDNQIEAVILDLDPSTLATISSGGTHSQLPPAPIAVIPVEIVPR